MAFNSGIKLTQLRALVAIANFGSFSEAAWQLGLTQPTVSHAISGLEDSLGIVLVSRTHRGAHVTPAGEAIVQKVHSIINLLSDIEEVANQYKGLEGGCVRIATFRGATTNFLPKLIAQFQRRYPGVEIMVKEVSDCTSVEQQVGNRYADIGITLLPTKKQFEVIQLYEDFYTVIIPPNYSNIRNFLSIEQLLELPLILYPEDSINFKVINRYFEEAGFHLNPRYQFQETCMILNMVAEGLGIAIIPWLAANSLPNGVSTANLPIPLDRTIAAILIKDALHPPTVYALTHLLKSYSQEEV